AAGGDFVPYHAYGGGGIRHRRRQWRGSARDQSDGICWQSVSLHQNSRHWISPAQRVPRSPLIRLARAQEPRPDVYGAPTPCRHGRYVVGLLANLNRRRPYDRLLVSSAATRIGPSGECSLAIPEPRRKAEVGIPLNEHVAEDGPIVSAHACRLGAESIVSKKIDGTYRPVPRLDQSPEYRQHRRAAGAEREAE